jgi:hypothetical protein
MFHVKQAVECFGQSRRFKPPVGMAGLVSAMHNLLTRQDVDARDKRGHDGTGRRVATRAG